VGVDVGGTFTDVVLIEEDSDRLIVRKVPTTPDDPVEGVISGVSEALLDADVHPDNVSYFGSGSTIALNTIIQRSGVKTGFLVTKGFRDILEIRRTRLPDAPSFEAARPISLVRRAHVREIPERMRTDGSVLRSINKSHVLDAAQSLADSGIESLAICFLHAYANSEHEKQACAWIAEEWPYLFLCASSNIWPQQREYERALLTVMNAFVGPTMERYYKRLEERLRNLGINAPVLVTQSNGGTLSTEDAARVPVRTVLSGPASGVIAAAKEGQEEDTERFFSLDMGGTSADMAVIDGSPRFSSESAVGDYPLFMPAIAIDTLGAGGGSIAWLDAQGILKVGPQSAGAQPGPACYNRGGTDATVTDAYLMTGIVGVNDLLGGAMTLSRERAEDALAKLGTTIGLQAEQTAEAVIRIATANMYAEFLPMVARYGVDQRDFSLVPYGGAGPTHAFLLAEEAGLSRILIPRMPGAMCALGAALADMQMDFVRSARRILGDDMELETVFGELDQEAAKWLSRQGVSSNEAIYERSADMRYHGQSFELNVRLDREAPAMAFGKAYEQVYGYQDPECPIEVLQFRLLARVPNTRNTLGVERAEEKGVVPEPVEVRSVLHGGGRIQVPVYPRESIARDVYMQGPAVLTQYDTTIFVTPGYKFRADSRGNILAEVQR
jgi:N-methylhydantoinase A